ncbi:unnamed protein product [Nippostrongylus brasiliensis]|uniref:Uncharacterized protein n=1 Tax=Nippostrongylus brasiliensis TaxID=27835 RepID=A0A158R3J4_NIPBR|nr:unnamed protein product [Nippostrongylus brasiliensis]
MFIVGSLSISSLERRARFFNGWMGDDDYYLRDIPMEIGHRFYPPPLINLPPLTIPELPRELAYPFEAEQRARQQFDDANRKPEPKPEQSHNVDVDKLSTWC